MIWAGSCPATGASSTASTGCCSSSPPRTSWSKRCTSGDLMRTVSLMGSTGSVGTQALDVVRREPERFRVHALAARSSAERLVAQAAEFRPDLVVIGDESRAGEVRAGVPEGTEVLVGHDGMVAAA